MVDVWTNLETGLICNELNEASSDITVNVADGPAAGAKLPARSAAVPAATEIPNEPVPVTPEMVTV